MRRIPLYTALHVFTFFGCATAPDSGPSEPIEPEDRYIRVDGSTVVAVGDTGTGDDDQFRVGAAMAKYCRTERCDFGVLLGDNIYPDGVSSPTDPQFGEKFEKPYRDLPITFYPSLGNHDHHGSWQAQVQYHSQRWSMPARYYKIHTEHADLFAIDSQIFDKDQQTWLDQSLTMSTAKWKVVYGHHPVYSSGFHGDELIMKRDLLPILKRNGVDFYLSGHDHNLELIERDGIVFIVSGAGGKLRSFKPWGADKFRKSEFGFSWLEFGQNQAEVRFIDHEGQLLYERSYK